MACKLQSGMFLVQKFWGETFWVMSTHVKKWVNFSIYWFNNLLWTLCWNHPCVWNSLTVSAPDDIVLTWMNLYSTCCFLSGLKQHYFSLFSQALKSIILRDEINIINPLITPCLAISLAGNKGYSPFSIRKQWKWCNDTVKLVLHANP